LPDCWAASISPGVDPGGNFRGDLLANLLRFKMSPAFLRCSLHREHGWVRATSVIRKTTPSSTLLGCVLRCMTDETGGTCGGVYIRHIPHKGSS
jgi:hypothetical protein